MASQQPAEEAGSLGPYEAGWVAITRALDAGSSWSGRERNCAYLNLGDGTFADASAISGLDFLDDGRCVVATDWDHDGDLDLWLRNRTGPQLRFMRNDSAASPRWIALELVGSAGNRDAVGARIVMEVARDGGSQRVAREVAAGDGYLSQGSLRQHFALPVGATLSSVSVRWPGGATERIEGLEQGATWRVVEGERRGTRLALPRQILGAGALPEAGPPAGRVILRTPFPLPPAARRALGVDLANPRALFLNLWSVDCAPCLVELAALAAHNERFEQAGLGVLPLNVDPPEAVQRAVEAFRHRIVPRMTGAGFASRALDEGIGALLEAVLEHSLGQKGQAVLPTSLLVDKNGWVQVIYLGPVTSSSLLDDAGVYAPGPRGSTQRSAWPGRWFFGVPRDLADLARLLAERGRTQDARFYELVARSVRRSPR